MLLVDLEGLDLELRNCQSNDISITSYAKGDFFKGLTLEVGRIGDGLVTSTRASTRGVGSTRPVTAEGDIENDVVLLEVLRNVARIASGEDG